MTLLGHAIAIATTAHAGQTDEAREPYILHPLRVMLAVQGETMRIVAVLHDVAEDCPAWPLDATAKEGFGPEVIEPLRLLIRPPDASYADYIAAIATSGDPIARAVKIADLQDHLHPNRAAALKPTHGRRYRRALERLTLFAFTDPERAQIASSPSTDRTEESLHA